ncbi:MULTISPECIES: YczE/YyaS/YitT family protein [Bacillus]|uniref:YczE/YyaS/YitT family protein n=1 Tax=Bacillus TaxID=1386 RepID=UPI000C76BB8B|nr:MULTISPECIES: YitT family protein [Bacillus]PLR81885.1 hypothetical protein CVD23_17785 [Bacillus sp. V33-4]RSK47254.1 YitT family protein [Bacillus canaveralius]
MIRKRKGQVGPRFFIYVTGLLIMSFGIVLMIKGDLGATPWDVLHVGLFYRVGLTIGSWSIIVGFIILTVAALISKEIPQFGAFLNMVLVGVFIDLYLLLPFLNTPSSLFGKGIMLLAGIVLMGYGMGLYISAQFGAGPRDSLMIAVTSKTGWKVRNVRAGMEFLVLFIGWQLGGPIFWGTILFSLTIGPVVGYALPQTQALTDYWLAHLKNKHSISIDTSEETKRGVGI